ncbi:MAG: metalloregulator ArsR/SmtB family transcription factor [bacterium]|nr:metalloregulator ArsR/SmtB family transcription factor [bacterium]MDT8367290.1 metalloregulator ArsR/SmtB family transcription factor [bacterium]
MEKASLAPYENQAAVFKALAHPARLFMVEQIAAGEKCVCELVNMLGLDTSTVSKHLTVLRNAGVLVDQKRGNMVFFTVRMECVVGFFSCVRKALESQAREHLAAVAG